ncbi:MAG: hypothetical protein AAF682_10670 [Planctomycetota bacterium]
MQPITFLLALAPFAATPELATPQPAVLAAQDDAKKEYEKRRGEAEGDVKALWALVDWCEANSMSREKRSCLRAILKLDEHDKKAHELLGHIFYADRWFTSERKLADFKRKEEEQMAKEKGLVRYGDGWAHPDDIPFLDKGMVKTPDGTWVDPVAMKRIEEGWRQQDLTWIAPAEFEQLDQGLWKCGESWLDDAKADEFHSELGQWWTIPGDYFHLYTTLPRKVADDALMEIERTFRDLTRIYGVVPTDPMRVLVVRSGEQYNLFAGGDERWPGTDALGLSSIHGAFFADGWMNPETRKWMGSGVGYWDFSSENGTSFGRLFARHAAGQSFGEAVDPSSDTVRKLQSSDGGQFNPEEFYGEKRVPAWFRYGAASYVERYFVDSFVAADGDPLWARTWSISNIARRGGLDSLKTIFEMNVGPDNPESDKLVSEAGLLVSFMLDSECAPIKEAHGAVKAALKSGDEKKIGSAFSDLEKALDKNMDDLRMFADL